jgi:predicted nucleic acid-binding protein
MYITQQNFENLFMQGGLDFTLTDSMQVMYFNDVARYKTERDFLGYFGIKILSPYYDICKERDPERKISKFLQYTNIQNLAFWLLAKKNLGQFSNLVVDKDTFIDLVMKFYRGDIEGLYNEKQIISTLLRALNIENFSYVLERIEKCCRRTEQQFAAIMKQYKRAIKETIIKVEEDFEEYIEYMMYVNFNNLLQKGVMFFSCIGEGMARSIRKNIREGVIIGVNFGYIDEVANGDVITIIVGDIPMW